MRAVLLSIHPMWCSIIASGRKTVEVRKTMPKLSVPFKSYIYCTKGSPYLNRHNGICYLESKDTLGGHGLGLYERLNGKVIVEFVCDSIQPFDVPYPAFQDEMDKDILEQSCLTYYQLHRYAWHDCLYGWHISNLKIYDTPKSLGEFYRACSEKHTDCSRCIDLRDNTCVQISRPPQSWCYVEDNKQWI